MQEQLDNSPAVKEHNMLIDRYCAKWSVMAKAVAAVYKQIYTRTLLCDFVKSRLR